MTGREPATPGWSISIAATVAGDPVPLEIPSHIQQVSTTGVLGRVDGLMRGGLRSATVTVDGKADGPLATLLSSGEHGATLMTGTEFTFGPLQI